MNTQPHAVYMYVRNIYYICIHDNIDVHVAIADIIFGVPLFPRSAEVRINDNTSYTYAVM